MASRKVPKLVIKSAKSTRRIKLPAELAAEEQAKRVSTRRRVITRTAVMTKKAKSSLHRHAYLLIISFCAAIVVYGIVAAVATPASAIDMENGKPGVGDNGPASIIDTPQLPHAGGTPADVVRNGTSIRWVCVDEKKKIFKKITTSKNEPTKVEVFQRIDLPEGSAFVPYTPPKPVHIRPTVERDKERRQVEGGTTPY